MSEILKVVLEAVITVIIPILTAYAIQFLQEKRNELKAKSKNEITAKYLDIAFKLVEDVVECTNQTYVDSLKKSGKFDVEAQKEAFDITFSTVSSLMTEECEKVISEVYGDLDVWLNTVIEQKVRSAK